MSKIRRLFALLLTCVCFLCLSVCFVACSGKGNSASSNEETVEGSKGLSYVLSKDKSYYQVTGMGTCTDLELIIPSTYKGLPVKEIRYDAFGGQAITSLVVPNGVIKIGEGAFKNCKKLIWAEIGDSVEQIDRNAFQDCNYLMRVKLPKNLKSIGKMVFFYCFRLVEIYNESAYNINDGNYSNAGTYCIQEHKSVNEPSCLFFEEDGCVMLTNERGKYFVGYLGEGKELTIPEGVTCVNNYALYNNINLTTVRLPSTITNIGSYSFSKCNSLEMLTIPTAVKWIGVYAIEDSLRLQGLIFENTKGWYYTNDRTATTGVNVSKEIMSNAEFALALLKENGSKYFLRSE